MTCTQEVDIVMASLRPRPGAREYYDVTTAFDFPFTGVAVRTVDHSLYLYTAFLSPFAYQVHTLTDRHTDEWTDRKENTDVDIVTDLLREMHAYAGI